MATEQETKEIKKETKKIVALLNTITGLAEEASLSGAFSGGERRCIHQHNNILKRLQEAGSIPDELFMPLEEDASFGEIGVACSLLAAYLKSGWDEETELTPDESLQNLQNIKELKDVGNLLRQTIIKTKTS